MLMRNVHLAKFINKLFKIYWFLTRPKTRGVKCLIFNEKEEVLMVRLTYYPETWTFVGGGVNKKESTSDAIIRECSEEVGIKLKDIKYVGELYFEHEYKKDTVSVYSSKVKGQDIIIDGKEIAEAKWFDIEKLPQTIGKNAQKIFDLYNKDSINSLEDGTRLWL